MSMMRLSLIVATLATALAQTHSGAQWRQNDLDMVKSQEFQKFLKDQGFILVAWRDLAKALPANWKSGAN